MINGFFWVTLQGTEKFKRHSCCCQRQAVRNTLKIFQVYPEVHRSEKQRPPGAQASRPLLATSQLTQSILPIFLSIIEESPCTLKRIKVVKTLELEQGISRNVSSDSVQ
ncbi:uncharacterized protein LOC107269900 [Cephus cinctus]|uniref:Uncharacterized protein LOC107269900 n=1 Tax=Cephus cinctus TaxID=211228 RepID=A0AAJ7RL75_CEPCN|nr:uncharacterized protein LOC107269900 [Cephus cinctus]